MKLFLLLSLVSASISFTVTEMFVFKWFRDWAATYGEWPKKLTMCGYCFGHWVTMALMIVYQPRVVNCGTDWIDFCSTWLAMAWLSGAQWISMNILFSKAGK